MDALIAPLVLLLVAMVLLGLPIWALIQLNKQRDQLEQLQRQVDRLTGELDALRASLLHRRDAPPPLTGTADRSAAGASLPAPAQNLALEPTPVAEAPDAIAPPPIIPALAEPPKLPVPSTVLAPPVQPPIAPPRPPPRSAVNWEQFMGAKLFAWLGGLALFLGVAFFVKYSFEHDLIPPAVRVTLGFLLGAGLIGGGLSVSRKKYAVTAQTLVASGVVSLYTVTFACNSIYRFEFFGPLPTFLLMTLITAAAFLLAVRLEAQVVAILGILGGFLTPILINTGHDNPAGLFGYLALLDVGLVAVALHRRWFHLVPLGAAGTVLMMFVWTHHFYVPEKTVTAMAVCLGFCGLFVGAVEAARRSGRPHRMLSWSAAAFPLVAFGFALFFLDYPSVAGQAGLYLGFVLLADAMLLALAWPDNGLPHLHLLGGLIAFALIVLWTGQHLTDELLPWALTFYLLFGAVHTAFPLLLQRRRPAASPPGWNQLFPPLALLLMLLPIMRLDAVPFVIWPAILLVDLLAVGLAILSASIAAVAAVLLLTLLAAGICIGKIPAGLDMDVTLLLIIGGFAGFFFAASLWLGRRLGVAPAAGVQPASPVFGDARSQLPAMASLLPFLLLIMVCARLAVPNPSAVFGLGLLLVVLSLGLARGLVIEWLPACALAGIAALEYTWHIGHFAAAAAGLPLVWYLAFYGVFALYPFLFRRNFSRLTGPWAVAAVSGIAQFGVIYPTIKAAWPTDFPGLIPALFAIGPLGSLAFIVRTVQTDNPKRLNQLAWFGGVALFFVTLVVPIQFERQWLTIAWALEGAALLWLFRRVPHPGLRGVGIVLLSIAFVRLALNPAILSYHVRGDTAIINWYLYAYGLVLAALFTGARLLASPRDDALGSAPALLNAFGVILAFLLLNIEIADFFTQPGARALAFHFSGNFARDMSYTIGWALFALGLLAAGIWQRTRAARYAAIALLSIALLKLFLHDLAQLEAFYRIGALFALAVIAILASFAYQRFLPGEEKTPPPLS